ncbi:MAG TPA: S1 family peptidase [Pseudonocardiaceae bacterium]
MLARRLPRALGAASALLLSLGLAVPASASPNSASPNFASSAPAAGSAAQVAAAQVQTLQREAGLSAPRARQRLAGEGSASSLVSTMQRALGTSFAGAWFAPGSTALTVATTDAAETGRILAAGAQPRLVSNDLLSLEQVMGVLDARSRTVPDSVTGWYVDPASNSVVVSATDPAAARTFATGLSDVRVKQVKQRPALYADLVGGDALIAGSGGRCSIGFNATAGNARYIITAGHCTALGGTWTGADGTPIGPVARSSFPGTDYGLIQVTSPSWTQTSSVEGNNGFVAITGATPVPVGASICRSGSSSNYHCGTVEAVNQTINYGGGDVVNGLTQTNVCAEPGDSGGPYFAGSQAQGTLSGGSGGCLLGGETYFQPIGAPLAAYGLTLVTGAGQASRSTPSAQAPSQSGGGLLGILGLG